MIDRRFSIDHDMDMAAAGLASLRLEPRPLGASGGAIPDRRRRIRGAISHLGADENDRLTVELLSVEAMTTSEIEGDILDRASVQSSICRQLGLGTDRRHAGAAEQGIAEMMVDVHRLFAEPLSDEMLLAWHGMLTTGRRDLQDVARYRRHEEAMQVVSGPEYARKVHF